MDAVFSLLSLAQRAYGRQMLQRLLLPVVGLMGVMLLLCLLITAALVGGLVAATFALLEAGIPPLMVALAITLCAAFCILVVLLLGAACLRQLRRVPSAPCATSPLAHCLTRTMDSFLAGLMTTPAKPTSKP